MALYNVTSPGGYMNTGLSIPSADILGFKKSYSLEKPWLFDDFDQITFYEVNEDEYEELIQRFRRGEYSYEFEEVEFDMKEHNQLLSDTADDVKEVKRKQREAQAEMDKIEAEMLEKWNKEKEEGKISMDTVEELLNDPGVAAIEAPFNANVWKVQVEEGDILKADQTVIILESMKQELNVNAESTMAGATVEKLIVKPNEVVDAGSSLMLVRLKGK